MNSKLELFIRVVSSFIEEDGFAYFTYTNLNNVGKHDSLKSYFSSLVESGAIEDFTKNGYAKKIKINKPMECPDFLFNGRLNLWTKSYLLEQWNWYIKYKEIHNINISQEKTLLELGLNTIDIISNAKIIKNKISSSNGVLIKDEYGYKITIPKKEYYCEHCGETNPENFGNAKNICKKCYANLERANFDLADRLYRRSSKRAHTAKLQFNLTKEDIEEILQKQDYKCCYTGIKFGDNFSNKESYPTLDRIDSSKGYIKGNICICTYTANTMKSNLSISQFKDIIIKIYNNINNF